jgi:hypothetical protein
LVLEVVVGQAEYHLFQMVEGFNNGETNKMLKESSKLISRQHLADRWSVSTETLKRRERAGLLPSLKLGTRVRYRISDIEIIEKQAEVSL